MGGVLSKTARIAFLKASVVDTHVEEHRRSPLLDVIVVVVEDDASDVSSVVLRILILETDLISKDIHEFMINISIIVENRND